MRFSRVAFPILMLVFACLSVGCDDTAPSGGTSAGSAANAPDGSAAGRPLRAVATTAPLAYFTGRIGGDAVAVDFPVPDSLDPADWSPKGKDLPLLQEADLVVLNGAGLESWRSRVALRESRVVETGEAIRPRWIEVDGPTHSHGMSGSHSHAGTAPHTWLDPTLAIEQARAILKALGQARPDREAEFAGNFKSLERDLLDLDARYEAAVGGRSDRPVLFSHPVYEYLTRRYGLNARSLDWEPGEVPYEEQWDALVSLRAEFPANAVLWEATPLDATARRLSELGVSSFTFALGGSVRPSEWLEAMRRNADALRAALE
jgi:zinc transport system substrate-binding protein